ncbi:MAG: hypothetical protein ACOX4Q_12685 [Syntrophomonadales bacterium]
MMQCTLRRRGDSLVFHVAEEVVAAAAAGFVGAETGVGPVGSGLFEFGELPGGLYGPPGTHDVPGRGYGPEGETKDSPGAGEKRRNIPGGDNRQDYGYTPEDDAADPGIKLFFLIFVVGVYKGLCKFLCASGPHRTTLSVANVETVHLNCYPVGTDLYILL